ncbi:MAG: CopG family antitoxin, partial [Candidatus Dormibacteraceae bacterium]
MTDEEYEEHWSRIFEQQKKKSVGVHLRVPEELLRRIKRMASAEEIPYQTLIKRLLDADVGGWERHRARAT